MLPKRNDAFKISDERLAVEIRPHIVSAYHTQRSYSPKGMADFPTRRSDHILQEVDRDVPGFPFALNGDSRPGTRIVFVNCL